MERQVMFRAKGSDERDKDRWYQGYYYSNSDTTYCFTEDYESAARMGKHPRHHYILFDEMTDWGLPNRHLQADIRPETLCQCTGRMDKNHKSIFEWDIVALIHRGETTYHLIEWRDDAAAFVFSQGEVYNHFDSWHPDCEFEVVGNKFDNPELLTKVTQFTPASFIADVEQTRKKAQGQNLSGIKAFLDDRGLDYKRDDEKHTITFKGAVIQWTPSGYTVTDNKGARAYASQRRIVNQVINPLCGNAYKEV